MHGIISELYPICRSITGDGVRQTLNLIRKHVPLEIREVPSGTPIFDWTVPKEWNIRDAYVKDSSGRRVIDFKACNLHVVSYSVPVRQTMFLAELRDRLYSLPDHPDWIPFRTSYFQQDWGFCLSHQQLSQLRDDLYEVCIDSRLEDGHLTYGEYYVRGQTSEEVLISCHCCHPSLCNDNLSGISLVTMLAKLVGSSQGMRYSYRFLFIPATIGSLTWLSQNEEHLDNIKHGLVVTLVGDSGPSTYKKSRRGNAEIDRAARHVLKQSGEEHRVLDFTPWGYDERQYCSPGFDLAVGCLMRTPHGQFPEYHTSADNLEFVKPETLADSFLKCWRIVSIIEGNRSYINLNPKGEPQLGRRGLFTSAADPNMLPILWVLNASDGRHSLLDIAERSGIDFWQIKKAADALLTHGLLREEPFSQQCIAN